ncbi:MAG: radical SAM protein, partial [Intestinibacter sp.]|uniref:radical SAM (seleno)protein TrsS n=1 Tax=Intestinibacter sp. TaxID=1965304 RepID=UPI0025B8EC0C
HRQETCCVLLELTDRCNLKCPICFASANEDVKPDVSIERVAEYFDYLMDCGGPYNIQLSGGEPTMRDDLDQIIKIGREKGFTFFQLNTNGIRIAEDADYIKKLAEAGLNTVFLQFDGLTEKPYIRLRGKKLLRTKLKAIENCKKAGVGVVLVPTVEKDANLDQLGKIIEFAINNMPAVRGVHFQPISYFGRYENRDETFRITIPKMIKEIEKQMNGKMKVGDFMPGGAENSYCSFHANFLVNEDRSLRALGSRTSCCSKPTSSKQSREFVAKQWSAREGIDTNEPINCSSIEAEETSCCCSSKPEVKVEEASCCCSSESPKKQEVIGTKSLDDFIERFEKYTLAISAMLFQDAWNLDIDRLKQCYIHVVSDDENIKLVPFCAYNLTNTKGEYLYRK